MECSGKIFFQLQVGKAAPLKFDLFDQIFSFLPTVVALVFTVIFQRKNQKHRTCKSDQSQDDGFLEVFWLFAQKPRLHLTQLIWSDLFQKYDKNAQKLS